MLLVTVAASLLTGCREDPVEPVFELVRSEVIPCAEEDPTQACLRVTIMNVGDPGDGYCEPQIQLDPEAELLVIGDRVRLRGFDAGESREFEIVVQAQPLDGREDEFSMYCFPGPGD